MLGFLLSLSSCVDLEIDQAYYDTQEDFQLLYDVGAHSDFYKRHVIDYFNMIALGSEFGPDIPILRRWSQPMRIHIKGNPSSYHIEEVKNVVNDIRSIAHENFRIELVEDQGLANMFIFFGSQKDYLLHFPDASKYLNDNDGFFMTYHDKDFNTYSGHVFINIERNHSKIHRHITREELTQALGLGNDIPYYSNSIFFESPSDVTSYSKLDKEVIRLLYHPKLVSGLGKQSVENILKKLLGVK